MPKVAFFVCENRAQDYFWKPEYQTHANNAIGITAVYLSSPAPERDAAFVSKMFRGEVTPIAEGCVVACGPSQELRVLTPQAIAKRDSSFEDVNASTPILAGIALATRSTQSFHIGCESKRHVYRVGTRIGQDGGRDLARLLLGVRLIIRDHALGLPCCARFPCVHAAANTPV
jgi:hypothetical protein